LLVSLSSRYYMVFLHSSHGQGL